MYTPKSFMAIHVIPHKRFKESRIIQLNVACKFRARNWTSKHQFFINQVYWFSYKFLGMSHFTIFFLLEFHDILHWCAYESFINQHCCVYKSSIGLFHFALWSFVIQLHRALSISLYLYENVKNNILRCILAY